MAAENRPLTTQRPLPQNLDAERGVLGSMLLSTEAQLEVMGILTCKDFIRPSHQAIFSAMADLFEKGVKYDHISLMDKLTSDGELENAGGASYLAELTGSAPTTSHYKRYADIVKKLSTYRKLVFAGADISSMAYESPEDLEIAVARTEARLFEVTDHDSIASEFKPLGGNVLTDAYDNLYALADSKTGVIGVPTGFQDLDMLTRGFKAGQFIVLGARPGVGKTALALNIAANAASKGVKVGIFSLEMEAEDLAMRMLTSEAMIGTQQISAGNVPDSYWDRFTEASDVLSKMPIDIDDTSDLNINRLRVKARRHLRNVDGQKLIIVDYLQLMTGNASENRQNEVAGISRGLKILANELKVPILALSQLTRPSKLGRGTKRPQLSDLRESGAIEQDADIVMFLHREMDPPEPGEDDEGRMPEDYAQLIVAKHRNGPTANIGLSFTQEYARFLPWAKGVSYDPQQS